MVKTSERQIFGDRIHAVHPLVGDSPLVPGVVDRILSARLLNHFAGKVSKDNRWGFSAALYRLFLG